MISVTPSADPAINIAQIIATIFAKIFFLTCFVFTLLFSFILQSSLFVLVLIIKAKAKILNDACSLYTPPIEEMLVFSCFL